MTTFNRIVSESLTEAGATLEFVAETEDMVSCGYRVDPTATVGEHVSTVAAAFTLAVREGRTRGHLLAHVYPGDADTPAAGYCIDADWARSYVLGDASEQDLIERIFGTLRRAGSDGRHVPAFPRQ